MRKFLLTSAALLALAVPAHADVVRSGFLTSDHCTGGCGPQPGGFGKITATDHENGTIDILVALNNNNKFVGTGFPLSFGFNLDPNTTITYSNLTAGFVVADGFNIGMATGNLSQNAGSYGQDGFGTFEYGVDWTGSGGSGTLTSTLSFTISGTGLDITDFAQLSSNPPGGDKAYFVADIISGTNFGSDGKGNTGLVDLSTVLEVNPLTPPVPEPSTWAMMLIGFLGVGLFGMRRRVGSSPFRMIST
jgi:hypothetical protein